MLPQGHALSGLLHIIRTCAVLCCSGGRGEHSGPAREQNSTESNSIRCSILAAEMGCRLVDKNAGPEEQSAVCCARAHVLLSDLLTFHIPF